MKKRSIVFGLIIYFLIAFSGIFASVLAHEAGHALGALWFGVPITKVKIGLENYIQINAAGASDFELAVISLGSFIFPEIIYLILMISKNIYVNGIRIFFSLLIYIQNIFSIVIVIIGSCQPEMWDILLFQQYSHIDTIIIIAGLILMLVINIVLEVYSQRTKYVIKFARD